MSQTKQSSYPTRTMRNIGDIVFIKQKGEGDRPELALWDYVRQCSDECPIRHLCPATSTLCTPEKEYLQHVIRLIFEYEEKKMIDRHGLHVFGTTILPLYQQLFLFKVEAMGLTTPLLHGKFITVHPIYREIRATMKIIASMWAAIGIKSAAVPAPEVLAGTGKKGQTFTGYYEMVQDTSSADPSEDDSEDGNEAENVREPVDPAVIPPKPRNDYRAAAAPLPTNVDSLLAAAQSINNSGDAETLRMEQAVNEAALNHTNFKGSTGLQYKKAAK